MNTFIKSVAAAALITGSAAAAHASTLAAEENNPGINDSAVFMSAGATVDQPLLDPSSTFDVNGDLVRKNRMGDELMAQADTTDTGSPYGATDINGQRIPSGY